MSKINLGDKLAQFEGYWQPRVVGAFNGHDLMVVKVKGQFPWHSHPDTDDFFQVLQGERIDFSNGTREHLRALELALSQEGIIAQEVDGLADLGDGVEPGLASFPDAQGRKAVEMSLHRLGDVA